jgi:bifunctional non-homologous end joining protein LigD
MKAKLVEKPPATGDWIYELKFDGIRLIATKEREKVSLLSRNQNDLSARFPEVVDAVKNLLADEFVLDGEVVALDEEGRSSFQLLQAREMEGRKSPIYFYAFDLLQLDGKSFVSLPLEVRKNVLEKLCAGAHDPRIRYSGAMVEMPTSSSRKCNAAAWKESSANYATRLRTRPEKRRMDQTQMCQRTGIRHWRIHPAARGAQTFRRNSRRLLQGSRSRIRR